MDNDFILTEQGVGSPVPVGKVGGEAGPNRPSASDCGISSVSDQAEVSNNTTGTAEEEETSAFTPKSSLRRTPLKEKYKVEDKSSVGDNTILTPTDIQNKLNQIEKANNIGEKVTKRKRLNDSPQEANEDDKKKVNDLKANLAKICKQIGHLEKVVREMYKPKRELTDTATRLALYAENLRQIKLDNLPDVLGEKPQREKGEEETQILRDQMSAMEKKYKKELEKVAEELKELQITQNGDETKNKIKCNGCKLAEEKEQKRQKLKSDETFDHFINIAEEDWESEVFPKLSEEMIPIWEAPSGWDIALPCNNDIDCNDRTVKRAIDKFGGKDGLRKQKKRRGEVALMTHSLGFPDHDGNISDINTWLYYPILTDKESIEDARDEDIFESVKSIKRYMIENNRAYLAVPEIEGVVGTIVKRAVEYLFFGLNIKVALFKNNKEKPTNFARQTSQARSIADDAKESKKPRRPKGDAVVIKMGDMKYADLLKTVKGAINPSEIGVDVKQIKETRKGELLVAIQNGTDKAEVLKSEIRGKFPNATVLLRKDKKVLHIKNLDSITTEEDVREAVAKITTLDKNNFEVRALRPAFGNKQNVTVVIGVEEANKLLQVGYIKIGWMRCRILERKEEIKCFRCWKYGHKKTECTGPNRENSCLKCSKEGHKAINCPNKEYCVNCGKEGHQTGSFKCNSKNNSARPLEIMQ